MDIRRAEEGDIEAVFGLESACFPDPWSRKTLRETLREERSFLLLAEEDGEAAGYINTSYLLDEMELNRICVLPGFRRRGTGAALLRAAFRFAAEKGVTAFFLEVRASNAPAQALYRSAGFAEVGRRKRYYHDPDEDAVLMRADVGETGRQKGKGENL